MESRIAVLKGDGIGPEVTEQAVRVLRRVEKRFGHRFVFEEVLGGGAAIDATGHRLPEESLRACEASDAILFGAVGGPKWDDQPGENRPEMAVLDLRKRLGLYANLRPAIVFSQLAEASPLKREIIGDGLDLLVVRELTGGIYFGPRGTTDGAVAEDGDPILKILASRSEAGGHRGAFAFDVEQYAESEIRRIGITAFELAKKRKGRIVSVDKSNVLDASRLWRRVMEDVGRDYSEVSLSHMYVDNAAMQLVRNPRQFDVIVTNNMFGDILSDEASQITGSIGMMPSASLAEGSFGLYEPIHGSAPDIAGRDEANPIASILSAAMLLRYSLSASTEADAVEKAVSDFLSAGYRTPDIYAEGTKAVGTEEAGALIAEML
jgi:3-isopropylmalate dehydrogenase